MLAMGGFGVPGKIYTLVSAAPSAPAANLSQTGCIDPARRDQPSQGAIPYNVNAPFFSSDTLYKERFLYLPPNGKIFAANDGRLVLPIGSVVMKTFRDGPKMVETRLMMYHSDGEWSGWSYKWKDDQSDATLLEGTASTTLSSGETWTFPDRGDCVHCHTRPVLRTIGFESAQFNRDSYYPSTGRWANQLATLRSIGALQNPLPAEPVLLPALANPRDTKAPLEKRARSYLHTNCAHCHQPGGGGYGNADYRFTTPLPSTNACNASPIVSTFGLLNGKIIAPGAPGRSVLVERLSRSDAHRMNPYRETIDGNGVALMQNWIGSLQNCTGP